MRSISAPVAKKDPRRITVHGHERIDDYAWLREKDNPDVIAYLEAENRYADAMMRHTRGLQAVLFEEMKGRMPLDDIGPPVKIDDYWYYSRAEVKKQRLIHCRKKFNMDAPEEVVLDENQLAAGHAFFNLDVFSVSPNHKLVAYIVDVEGSEHFTMYIRDLETGRLLPEHISNVSSVAWFNDSSGFFYVVSDGAARPCRVFGHRIGISGYDTFVYEEHDGRFSVEVSKTRSRKYILITSTSYVTTEVRYIPADEHWASPVVFQPREEGHEYNIDHVNGTFLVRTNDGAQNFRLAKTAEGQTEKRCWQTIVSCRSDVMIEDMDVFKNHLVLYERRGGVVDIRVFDLKTMSDHYVRFSEAAYCVTYVSNPVFETSTLRYGYSSFITPDSIFDYDMATREKTLVKQNLVHGHDPSRYAVERVFAASHDGTPVPISLAYRRDLKREGGKPLLLYGYGSYGEAIDPNFNGGTISLLDRGFIFAIAHIRGGGDMGVLWYEEGKYLKKKNSFYDFIACGEYLCRAGYTTREQMVIMGGSAGGLLIGAVLNMRPDLWGAAVARVPFVDVVNTMLDSTLPLTIGEYEEWGNPNEEIYYRYMLSYSPYDQVSAQRYPKLLVTAGLHDRRVGYWEPAKWVARLRTLKQDTNVLFLKTNMGGGHRGASGRFNHIREKAFVYAFIINAVGLPLR